MSEINDSTNLNPITEIQIYLKIISKQSPEIIVTHTDGIFDSETRNSIIKFQELYNLPPTGIVDIATWGKLLYEYNKITSINITPNKLDCFPSDVIEIKFGDEKSVVYIIQTLLNNFSSRYKNFNNISLNGIYNQETVDAVRKFQSVIKLPETGVMDIKTWNALTNISRICRMHDM